MANRSGFRSVRDAALFVVGGVIVAVHLASTYATPDKISAPTLVVATGIMVAPAALKRDEDKDPPT